MEILAVVALGVSNLFSCSTSDRKLNAKTNGCSDDESNSTLTHVGTQWMLCDGKVIGLPVLAKRRAKSASRNSQLLSN